MSEADRKLIQADVPPATAAPVLRTRQSWWPYLIIAIGVSVLLDRFIPMWNVWSLTDTWWPLALIIIGVGLLTRPYPWGRMLTLGLVIAGVILAAIWAFTRPASSFSGTQTTENISQPITAARAEITLENTVGSLEVSASRSDKLIDGTLELSGRDRLRRESSTQGGVQTMRLEAVSSGVNFGVSDLMSRNNLGWSIGLSPKLPLKLRVKTGVGSGNLELTELKITDLTVNVGVGQMTVMLPATGKVTARIEGGVGELNIVIPRGMGAQIRATSGLGQVSVNGDFQRSGDVYTSSGYASASDRVDLEVKGGIGRITVEQSSR